MVNQCLHYGEQRIPYRVFFLAGKKDKLVIHVLPDGDVQVDAPRDASLLEIKRAVARRARWLDQHLQRIDSRETHILPREYVSGESHFYLGRRHLLKVRQSRVEESSVKLHQGRFEVITQDRDRDAVSSLLRGWYRARARILLAQRLELVSGQLSWVKEVPRWKLTMMKRQWGSCSPSGILSLNPHMVKAPLTCIHYVLTHELCHLKHHNHSQHFYRLLARQMPQWRAVKRRLDEMAELLLSD